MTDMSQSQSHVQLQADLTGNAIGTSAAIPVRCVATNEHDEWREEVKKFITDNYCVQVGTVTTTQLSILFRGHYEVLQVWISYFSLRNTFARKKDIRPPTRRMRQVFERLKYLQSTHQLHSFIDMPLKFENLTAENYK